MPCTCVAGVVLTGVMMCSMCKEAVLAMLESGGGGADYLSGPQLDDLVGYQVGVCDDAAVCVAGAVLRAGLAAV
jgi:hypothetical protein